MNNDRLYSPVHQRHIDRLRGLPATIDDEGLRLGPQYVMFFAEDELMSLHAEALLAGLTGAHVLEIGVGLGVFADQAAHFPIASYTAIDPHPDVVALTRASVLDRLGVPVTVHVWPWQLTPLSPSAFDAIMYDTWPPDGMADEDFALFIEHVALPCLRPGGRFSFFHSGTHISRRRSEVLDKAFPGWTTRPYALPPDRVPLGWTKPTHQCLVPVAEKGTE